MCVICLGKEYIEEKKIRKIEDVCEEVIVIPTIPKLKRLVCANSKVNMIHYQPDLEYLDCSGCLRLGSLPRIDPDEGSSEPEEKEDMKRKESRRRNYPLKFLDCSRSSVLDIPSYNNLVRLECDGCPRLQSITDLNNLESFVGYKCPNLSVVKNLPRLLGMDVMNSRLKIIEGFPLLRCITCSYSEELVIIRDVPSIREISCLGCKSLTHILDFEICTNRKDILEFMDKNCESMMDCKRPLIKLRLESKYEIMSFA